MSGKFGGGGAKCAICDKTAYPAETIQFEKKPYHVDCFKCTTCEKKMEGPAKAQQYEDKLYCAKCFQTGGFTRQQVKSTWKKSEGGAAASGTASKFGGGGNPCTICAKTVYPAEQLSYDKSIYHQACFTCKTCEKKLTPSGAARFEEEIFCTKCFGEGGYRQKQAATTKKTGVANPLASKFGGGGNKCEICEKTVYTAETVSFEKKAYHGDCFKCSLEACGKLMTPSNANIYEGAIICSKCFKDNGYSQKQAKQHTPSTNTTTDSALAGKFGGGGNKCSKCDKTVYPAETVSFEKTIFHGDCFTCLNCEKKLENVSDANGKKEAEGGVSVYCKKCWGELGLNKATTN